MASFIAKHTIGHFTKKAKSALKTHDDSKEAQAELKAGGIDWSQHNYPRFLNICHYDINVDPIPSQCKRTVRHVYIAAHTAEACLVFNLFSNIGLVASKEDASADHILFSVLHLILGTALIQFT